MFVVILVLPAVYITYAVAVLSAIATWEMSRALGQNSIRLRIYTMALSVALPFWFYYDWSYEVALLALFLYVLLVFIEALTSGFAIQIEAAMGVAFFSLMIPFFFSSIVRVSEMTWGRYYVLVPFLVAFVSDAFAMFTGMFLGKHKLAPSISPKKTVEGSIGGILGAALGIVVYGLIITTIWQVPVSYGTLLFYGLLGAPISQLGDLGFSYIKRQHKIKDFGKLFPGHGGVLDRFDSVIFCAPVVELLIYFLPALG